jgi:hypothetical protein
VNVSKGSRWQPPHPDPAKVPKIRIVDTPVGSHSKHPEPKRSSGWGVRCAWPECTEYPDPFYEVHLCTEHAHRVRNTINRYEARIDQRIADAAADIAARKQATAEKIESGYQPGDGDIIPGWVYYIELDGLIKIGFSKNVTNRMRQYAPTAKLLAAEPGTKKIERARHQHFGGHLARGREWFHDVPPLREWIDTVINEYGGAGHLAYTWGGPGKPAPVASKRIRNRRR